MTNQSVFLYLPPLFRFFMELTAWLYFIVLAIQDNVLYFVVFIVSAMCLAMLNFPGDKKVDGPVNLPGWARISNELICGGLFGIIGSILLFGDIGMYFQLLLVIITMIFDHQRYLWMLGMRKVAPEYVTMIRSQYG